VRRFSFSRGVGRWAAASAYSKRCIFSFPALQNRGEALRNGGGAAAMARFKRCFLTKEAIFLQKMLGYSQKVGIFATKPNKYSAYWSNIQKNVVEQK